MLKIPLNLPVIMRKTIFAILLLFASASTNAQNDTIVAHSPGRFQFSISYVSSLIYPGLSAGTEYLIRTNDFSIRKNDGNYRYISKSRLAEVSVNWYHHTGFHDNLYLTVEYVMRRTRKSGLITEFAAGPGFSRTFLGGTTYKVNDNGDVSIIKHAGYNYALVTAGGGFGFDFSSKVKRPYSLIARLNMIAMFPYNSTVYIRPVLEVGFHANPFLWNK